MNPNLKFNPFPRSGTSNINGSDLYNKQLIPVDKNTHKQIVDFIESALKDNEIDPEDKFISATITGDYGSGKTQLLMYTKYLLGDISSRHKNNKNPYVIYIDNPGVKLLEFIGAIISKIGEETFKKFIWTKIINTINKSQNYKHKLKKFQSSTTQLFEDVNPDPYSEENSTSYKKFLNSFVRYFSVPRQRKEFDIIFKEIITEILELEVGSSILAQYFYLLIAEDYGVNKTWEALSTGSIKQLHNKEAEIIKYIVKLIKEQGYTDFFILVDEFEDITEGRLTKTQVDNYVYNLRTLLDKHRSWCLLFAMTGQALRKLRSVSPPLADRITSRQIMLNNLNLDEAKQIALNHLNVARDKALNNISPFNNEGIEKLNELVEGNPRRFLKNCYYLIEKASEDSANIIIDDAFVAKHYMRDIF